MPGPHRFHPRDGGPAGDSTPAGEPAATGPDSPKDRPSGGDRGQTTLDFAIGIVLFLTVILFVFAFVPGILEPFNLSGEQDTVLSERIASQLSQGALGDPSTPYVLESSCTVNFFEEGPSYPPHCEYSGNTLQDRIHVEGYRNVNVSIEGNFGSGTELACWDGDDNQAIVGKSDGDCSPGGPDDRVLAVGGTPADGGATVTSRRVVSLHQRNVTMKVVVW